ncbi:MAG: NdvB protein, partial [Pseudomonadota bacterium]
PNYYRGAVEQYPRTAGRSSQLFHTGAASWLYRIVIEDLFGLRGCLDGLRIGPHLPSAWSRARIVRPFRGALVEVSYQRHDGVQAPEIRCEQGELTADGVLRVRQGQRHQVQVMLPQAHG